MQRKDSKLHLILIFDIMYIDHNSDVKIEEPHCPALPLHEYQQLPGDGWDQRPPRHQGLDPGLS